ncbi:hypothetical protein L083_2234 [Actinoplanes sp. N902-109]|nr:hypothetical protein L083_2234 [Actinoplanes sp. N902-109]
MWSLLAPRSEELVRNEHVRDGYEEGLFGQGSIMRGGRR